MKEKRETLGNNVLPTDYNLRFEPNLKTFKYKCTEIVSIQIKKSTKNILINALNLRIKSATVISKGKGQKAVIKTDKKLERIDLRFKNAVSGKAELRIEFGGINGEKLLGFYRSKYMVGSKEHYILTTQFEAPDARRAFPCFDEPIFKATFELSFILDKKLSAISNMPEKSVKFMGNKKLVTFQKTPKMSSYLLYFGIGEFEKLKGRYGEIDLNVITVPGKIALAGTALEFGKKFMRYYEDYFGIKYPLPKMDFIAVPDFAIGGMENWGAITYSEIALLTDKKATSIFAKQRIGEVVAHELAHQWFGDLVTMEWWDNLWLNESFATFMSYKALDAIYPKWQMGLQAILGRTAGALGADQLRSTQPVGVKVNSPGDMSEAFDPPITYSKGAALLVMLEDYVGAEKFRKGLHNYIKAFAYSNATEHDLWKHIGKAIGDGANAGKFDRIASYWINKPGYPVVELKQSSSAFELEQRRFFLMDRSDPSVWPIPIHYLKKTGRGREDGFVLLDKKRMKLMVNDFKYIKLNLGQKGFYRVKYPDSVLEKLGKLIKSKGMSALDAWGIENDLFSLARASKIKVSIYLDFVERYCLDCEYPLNSSISGHLNAIYYLLKDGKIGSRIKRINSDYHNSILRKLGWFKRESDSNTTVLIRVAAILSLGMLEDKAVVKKAQELFQEYLRERSTIEPDIRSAVYRINARMGDAAAFEKFISLYRKVQIPEDKIRLMAAIGSFKEPKLIDKALKFTMSDEVRRQYVDLIPTLVSNQEYGKLIIWKWIKGNWKKLMSMYDRGPGGLEDFIGILTVVDDKKRRNEIEHFFKNKTNYRDDIKRSIVKTLEYIDINIRFKEFNSN